MREATENNFQFDSEEIMYFYRKYITKCWFYCAKSLHEVNQKCTAPLFSWQMQQEFTGLSRIGRNYTHMMGIGLDSRSYDRIKKEMIGYYSKEVDSIVRSRQCIIGFDNYTHIYRAIDLRAERQTQYNQSNFTVAGVCKLPDHPLVSMEPKALTKNYVLASLPENLEDLKPFQDTVSRKKRFYLHIIL